ncbi:hypothetical protein JCGZ_02285 [Jatropha curcas]|uniref:Uncharacterized protein n=1 Tax=Jatropha curcas TaxID=180498 RepID=A0A067KVY7_JATCU|nr:hypothetical protein JCGZ_02285 [Jatropha curcas]
MRALNITLAAFLLLSLHVQLFQASRLLHEDLNKGLVLESLQRGPVPPSGPSGCTNGPNSGGPSCPNTVSQMNFAGAALPRSTAYPRPMVEFGVAANHK